MINKLLSRENKDNITLFTLLTFSLAIWLITRPFSGVIHDNVLYALQALHILEPKNYKNDLFFLYGSQDQYTLFSNLYAFTIKWFGLTYGSLALEMIGLILWLIAAFNLTRILPILPAITALVFIITSNNYYGSHNIFGYAEPYLTARLYAELFSLVALSTCLRRQWQWSIFSYFIAFIMHPLIALPTLIIGLSIWLRPKIWLTLILSSGLIGLLLGVLGIKPFTGLVQPMDEVWWKYNFERSPFLFLNTWHWYAFSQIFFTLAVTLVTWLISTNDLVRRLAWSTLASTVLLMTISFIGGTLLHLPFIVSLQLPRILWIAIIINPLLITALLWECHQLTSWHIILATGLGLGLFLSNDVFGLYAVAIVLISLLGHYYAPSYRVSKGVWILLIIIALQIILFSILNLNMDVGNQTYINSQPIWRLYLKNPLIALLLFSVLYTLLQYQKIIATKIAIILTSVLLIWGIINWYDKNSEEFNVNHLNNTTNTFYDSIVRQNAIEPIRQLIPPEATVYWVENPQRAWFWLKRANYVSFNQGAGAIFNRETTMELLQRIKRITNISEIDSNHAWDQHIKAKNKLITLSLLAKLCQDPILDYVIAENYQADVKVIKFKDPLTNQQYGLYSCSPTNRASIQ